jgi:alpha-N-arabinofuranosidase
MDPKIQVVEEGDRVHLHLTLDQAVQKSNTALVTTALLGKAKIPGLPFENADGSPLVIDTDYFGKTRDKAKPSAGPFENPGVGKLKIKVW